MSNTNNTTKNGSTNYGTKRGGRRRGFTLIEILIVVVILGVLAALVIPGVTTALDDANKNAAIARASQITTMVTRYNQFNNSDQITPAADMPLTDAQLEMLTAAGYCTPTDLSNQVEGGQSKNWYYNATSKKFDYKK
jgi:prepilin-type N-terminal cleavage/methylation domain-containing protein